MALEFAKELLGDAYTGELEEKLEAKINELYAPKADLDAASARADGLQEQLNAANEAIGKFEGLDAEQVKAQIADYKQRVIECGYINREIILLELIINFSRI